MNNRINCHKRTSHQTFSMGLSCLLILTFLVGMLYNLPFGDASMGVKKAMAPKMNSSKKIALSEDELWSNMTYGLLNAGVKLAPAARDLGKAMGYAIFKYVTEEQKKNTGDPILDIILPLIQTYCKINQTACKQSGDVGSIINTAKKEANSIEKKLNPACSNISDFTNNPITIIILTRKCYLPKVPPSGTKMNMSSNRPQNQGDSDSGSGDDALSPEERKCMKERIESTKAEERQKEALAKVEEKKAQNEAAKKIQEQEQKKYWNEEFDNFKKNREAELQKKIKCLETAIEEAKKILKKEPKNQLALRKKYSAEQEIKFLKNLIKELDGIAKKWEELKNKILGEPLSERIDTIRDLFLRNNVKVYDPYPEQPKNNIVPSSTRRK